MYTRIDDEEILQFKMSLFDCSDLPIEKDNTLFDNWNITDFTVTEV